MDPLNSSFLNGTRCISWVFRPWVETRCRVVLRCSGTCSEELVLHRNRTRKAVYDTGPSEMGHDHLQKSVSCQEAKWKDLVLARGLEHPKVELFSVGQHDKCNKGQNRKV